MTHNEAWRISFTFLGERVLWRAMFRHWNLDLFLGLTALAVIAAYFLGYDAGRVGAVAIVIAGPLVLLLRRLGRKGPK